MIIITIDDDGVICQSFNCANVTQNDTCIMTVEHCAIVSA